MEQEHLNALKERCVTEGMLKYNLILFGDYLAKREGYKEHTGIAALHFYIIQKYHWTTAYVHTMSSADIRFLLAEEMHKWT